MWEIAKKLGVLVLTVSLVLSLANQSGEQHQKNGSGSRFDDSACSNSSITWIHPLLFSANDMKIDFNENNDFYRDSCPQAEHIVRSTMHLHRLYKKHSSVAPALLRLLFHDCFIQGCDASVFLDSTSEFQSEKDTRPNLTFKGVHIIQTIKSKLEEVCRATVSCADVLILSAREGVSLVAGPFYPLPTGRDDSFLSFPEVASYEPPSPHDDLSKTLTTFASRGFDERGTVSLLGAHNIGKIHCRFFRNRFYNFHGTGVPDPSLEAGYLNPIRLRFNKSKSHSEEPGMNMGYEGKTGPEFGTHYFKTLTQGKGILHADQQLMAGERTANWVEAYASERSLFRRDFAQVMMKISSLRVLTRLLGQIRLNCSSGSFEIR